MLDFTKKILIYFLRKIRLKAVKKVISYCCICAAVGILVGVLLALLISMKFPKVVYYNFDTSVTMTEKENNSKYAMLPCELSDYICDLSEQLEIDSDICVAILLQENPLLNANAIHQNNNGTFDCGLFQLNSRSIDVAFLPNYWNVPEEFDPFNWKMNTFYGLTSHSRFV